MSRGNLKTVSEWKRNVSFRHREGFSDVSATELYIVRYEKEIVSEGHIEKVLEELTYFGDFRKKWCVCIRRTN